MRFWDSSAIVPLLVAESATERLQMLFSQDPELVVWWATETECVSAIARRERDASMEPTAVARALARLRALADSWDVVQPTQGVREAAARFLRVHPLREGDALQIAAAFVLADGRPSTLDLIVLDERLAGVANREGFVLVV
jgi:predicted nucleic acid-binding protein